MKYLSILLVLCTSFCWSQNLVINPGFEDTSCVNNFCVQPINCAYSWYNPTGGSPDYNHSYCSLTYSSWCGPVIPNTFNQYGMMGAFMFGGGGDSREYIGGKLITPLINGEKYYVSFYTRICSYSIYGVRNIGIYFGDSLYTAGNGFFTYSPQVSNPINRQLTDSTIWYKIEGEFIASGGEKFITIGNFNNDLNTYFDTIQNGIDSRAYYYFDNVSIKKYEDTIVSDFLLYPNPNNGTFTLNYNLGEYDSGIFKLFNTLGQLVYELLLNYSNGIEILSLNLAMGLYCWTIESDNKRIICNKFNIVR